MKINLPGLHRETLPSGSTRWRVWVVGGGRKRVTLSVPEDHPEFVEAYHAARMGVKYVPKAAPLESATRGSIGWLAGLYLKDLKRRVEADQSSPLTLKKKTYMLSLLTEANGAMALDMPRSEVVRLRDKYVDRPATADSLVEAIRVLYRWGEERGHCIDNPAEGLRKIDQGNGGAVAWSRDDLEKFRATHPPGTMAHLALTLLMFTACRAGDAVRLGRQYEVQRDGMTWLRWQPDKKGSALVEIPMMPPLYKATRASVVQGPTYLLTYKGQPFRSPDSLGQMMRRWSEEAGLKRRTCHGIRKAAGNLLAEMGCSQHQIMAILGHTEAKTSEIYTRAASRSVLAGEAMKAMKGLDW